MNRSPDSQFPSVAEQLAAEKRDDKAFSSRQEGEAKLRAAMKVNVATASTRPETMTHVRTSPYYPQSNGKLERWNKSIKSECIRPGVPLSLADAERLVVQYVQVYNEQRLHSSLGYITPKDMLEGRQQKIHAERDRKLEQARKQREETARARPDSLPESAA